MGSLNVAKHDPQQELEQLDVNLNNLRTYLFDARLDQSHQLTVGFAHWQPIIPHELVGDQHFLSNDAPKGLLLLAATASLREEQEVGS